MSHALITGASSVLKRYAAALLPAAVILFGAVQVAIADETVTETEAGQLLALVAGLIVTFFVPLLSGPWAGVLKTGAAILAAIATLVIPLVTGFTWESFLVVAIAALNALMTQIGVEARAPIEASQNTDGSFNVTTLP